MDRGARPRPRPIRRGEGAPTAATAVTAAAAPAGGQGHQGAPLSCDKGSVCKRLEAKTFFFFFACGVVGMFIHHMTHLFYFRVPNLVVPGWLAYGIRKLP